MIDKEHAVLLPARRFYHVDCFCYADYVEFAEGSDLGCDVKDDIKHDFMYTRSMKSNPQLINSSQENV